MFLGWAEVVGKFSCFFFCTLVRVFGFVFWELSRAISGIVGVWVFWRVVCLVFGW